MLVLILLSVTALMLFLISRIMVKIEFETKDGKMISSSYRLSKETIFHMWAMFKGMMGSTEALSKLLMSVLGAWDEKPRAISIGKMRFVYISSPENCQIVLNSSNMIEKSEMYKVVRAGLGNGLVTAPPSIWKSHRRHIAPAFTSLRSIESYFDNYNEQTDSLIRVLEKTYATGDTFDIWVPVTKAAFHMILDSIVGGNIPLTDAEEDLMLETVVHVGRLFGVRIQRPWLHPRMMYKLYVKLMGYQKYFDFKNKLVDKIMSEKMRMYREKISDGAYEEGSITMMDDLLGRVDKGQFSYQEVVDEIVTLLAAGSEPTSLVISFTFLLLAGNPEIQEKAYAEISNIIDDDDKPIDMAMVEEMKYLGMCLKESLRMFPALPFAIRKATADIKLSPEFTIKNGTEVVIPHVMVHRNPKYYENPHVWNPENFTEEKEQSRHKFAYIPFSKGPRGCIGYNYVMMAGRVILAKVLRKYRLTTDVKPEDVRIEMDLLLRSPNGFPVQLHRRSR